MAVCRTVCLSMCLVLLSAHVPAADWTEFLGPQGNGLSDAHGLPRTWSETSGIAWKVPIPGLGWSSPVVSNGRIYLTTAVPLSAEPNARQSLHAVCLDAASGAQLWDIEVLQHAADEVVEMHQKNSHASPTPILEGDRLYVHFGPHGTACLQTDGKVLWKNTELRYAPQHGNGGSPAVAGNLLIVCCDGKDVQYVAALDKQSGQVAWKTDRDTEPTKGFSFCTPTVIEVNGQSQVICPGSSAVFAYDPATGSEIWRVNYGEGYSVVPRPIFALGLVYVCSGYGDERLLAIDPTGRGDITDTHVRWSTKKSTPKSPSVIAVGEYVFMVSDAGVASCLEARTGKQLWQHRLGGNYSATPICADGLLYFQSETGTTTVVEAAAEYREVAKNEIGEGAARTFATLAVVDNALLLRSETHLYRIQQ